jgi:TonB-linked SusC/RagA family outer membrane protein
MKHHIISVLCAMAISFTAFAQTGVKGTVTDKNGEAIVGAMVLNKDNGKWAVTDASGAFELAGAKKGQNLEITCMGYADFSVNYQGETSLEVTLQDDSLQLDETVVIGYGSVKKKDLTGSVGILNSQLIDQQSTVQLSQSLQGTIPGLQVTRSSSMPGASASLQIRGVTSINGSSPLILVDGMAVSSIDNVAPDDVEQITVLKDAASASIYGARAAAGVILITTKSAKEGQLSIDYKGEYSMITATEWAEYLTDPYNYMTMFNEYKWNDAGCPEGGDYQLYTKEMIDNYAQLNANDPIDYPDFDWKSAIVKNFASSHSHTVTLSYGNSVAKTRASVNYQNTDALYEGSNYERVNARIRNSINISRKLSADIDVAFKHGVKTDPTTTPLQAANMYPSIYLGLYPDGRVGPGQSGSNTLGILREGGSKNNRTDYINARIALSYKPVDGLDITASYKPTWQMTKTKTFSKAVPYYDAYDTDVILGYLSNHTTNDLTEVRNDANSYELSFVANYEKSFADAHNLNAMLGYEEYYYFHESMEASSSSMSLSDFPYLDLANKDNLGVSGSAYENAYRSVFGRIMYNYKNRYYLQANLRTDGSSRFAKDYRWGWFPSASVGWVVSNENWMQSVKPLTYLKFRASIGTLGNERIGNYPWQTSISFYNSLFVDSTGNSVASQMTAAQVALAVKDITWETTWTYDVGFDMNFFRDRLSLSADYYYKQTRDMLLSVEIPGFTGYSNPTKNVGTMHTNGWEAKIDWRDKIGDFTYSAGFNISDARSIMGDLGGKVVLGNQIIKEGEEYYAWYGYKSNGIIRSQEQLDNAATQLISTVGLGDIEYIDLGGNKYVDENGVEHNDPDGKISADYDKTVLGSSLPHFIFGGYLNFGWKGLNLGIMFNGVAKQTVRLAEKMVRPFDTQWLAAPAVLKNSDGSRNYWSVYNTDEENAKAQYPRLSYTSAEKNNYQMSDYWLMNGAYLRIKNINLSYTIPSRPLQKAGIKGLRFYFNIDDPFCFDNYLKGWDPEQTTNSYIARTYTLGVDIKF